jgi:flagella basal body P-ring formation protein FlgA
VKFRVDFFSLKIIKRNIETKRVDIETVEHDITEILLKVALNTIKPNQPIKSLSQSGEEKKVQCGDLRFFWKKYFV